jgi:hypothetical protein
MKKNFGEEVEGELDIMDNKKGRIKQMAISGAWAGGIGVCISFILNSTLAEISTSPFFAIVIES